MCVADVTCQEVSVCRQKCEHLFIPHKKKRTEIMQCIKAKLSKTCSVHHYDRNYLLCRSNVTFVVLKLSRSAAEWHFGSFLEPGEVLRNFSAGGRRTRHSGTFVPVEGVFCLLSYVLLINLSLDERCGQTAAIV